MDSLAFLERTARARPLPLYVLHGDESFLKRQVLRALRTIALGPDADTSAVSTYPGDKANFAAVHDELETVPFFTPRRLVIVENADPFVTQYRALLEKAVGALPERGTLVLDVKLWPANTRLAKLVDPAATIVCKAPPPYQLPRWCVQWAKTQHGKQLAPAAAELLLELVGAEMGLLDQELLKLAIYVDERSTIEAHDVDRLVGSSRAETTWKIFDAIGAGRSAEALAILDRLFDQGEEPLKILGGFGYQLRRLAKAARLHQQGMPLSAAMETLGVNAYGRKGFEQQLRHLGPQRAARLYDWLLEANAGLKGGSVLPPRTLLERLVIRLARVDDKVTK
jgi:DNA polymerase III subunit delta